MKTRRIFLAALACAGITLSGCSSTGSQSAPSASAHSANAELAAADATVEAVMAANQANHADADDVTYSADGATRIALDGASAQVTGEGAQAGDGNVTITSEGTYIVSGTYTGEVVVAAGTQDKVRLVLDNATIERDGAAIRATSGNELVVVTAEGTDNTLTDTKASEHAQAAAEAEAAGADDSSIPSGTIESHIDTTLGGGGTLNVTGGQNAISSSDGLAFSSGMFNVKSSDDGIRGKDYVWIEGGTVNVSCAGDAIQSTNDTDANRGFIYMAEGTVTVSESAKAIDAKTDLVIAGGTVDVTANDDAVEGAYILLAGGSGEVVSGDDPVNATADSGNPWIVVLDGDWVFNGEGDGFDSNGAARIAGGNVQVYGPERGGNGAVDTETGLTIEGGAFFAIGSQGMDEGPKLDSPQASVKFTGDFASGDELTVTDSKGTVLGTFSNRSHGQSIFFSSKNVKAGESYIVKRGSEELATAKAGDYEENMMGGMGGNPGGMPGGMPGEGDGHPRGEPGEAPSGMPQGEPGDMLQGTPKGE